MRRNDVTLTSFRRHVPTRFLINQCQIITFLILKSVIIENSRIELRGIVLPVPSNQIKEYEGKPSETDPIKFKIPLKLHFLLFFTLQLGTFVIFYVSHGN